MNTYYFIDANLSNEFYPSAEGTTGSLVVYTPPAYEKDPSKQYPVSYLISGTTDTEDCLQQLFID